MGPPGFEDLSQELPQATVNIEDRKTPFQNEIAETVQDPVHHGSFPPELEQIIAAWETLPEHIKAAVLALIDSHT